MSRNELLNELGTIIAELTKCFNQSGRIHDAKLPHAYALYGEAIAIAAYLNIHSKDIDLEQFYGGDREAKEIWASELARNIHLLTASFNKENKKFELDSKYLKQFVSLSKEESEKIQNLINELREIISDSQIIGENHKRRLLKRLESLQLEIHKSKSDVEIALAGLGEVGAAFGRFGKSVKPIVDRMEQIVGIFESKRDVPLELPSPPKPKQLPGPGEQDDDSGKSA